MGFIIKENELEKIRELIKKDGKVRNMWFDLNTRVNSHIQPVSELWQKGYSQIMIEGDTQEWWHLIWERLSDVAFVQTVKPAKRTKKWLRDTVLDIIRKPADDWVGPWFRERTEPLIGHLETSHVGVAVATVLDLCPEIFTEEEIEEIKENLKEKCQILCLNWINRTLERHSHINNWFMVLINGYGTVSAVLGDDQGVRKTIDFYHTASRLYNEDSYGESIQYWNYATIHLSHLYEVLVRYNPDLESELDYSCYMDCLPWVVSSFMYMKQLAGWGREYPRTINFGDSAAIFRPTADILLHIAYRAREDDPQKAGMARWLFETTYKIDLPPYDRASFGFFNQYQFMSFLLYDKATSSLSPENADLPLTSSFATGTVINRNKWENPDTVLGIQGGYNRLNVASHRHGDQNSFILSHLKERFFVDPGHCCYRLKTQAFSKSTASHNTWLFEDEEGNLYQQKEVSGNIFVGKSPLNRLMIVGKQNNISVTRSDASDVYGKPVTKAERTWIMAMPNALFIVDRIKSEKPVSVRSNFLFNNRDNKLKYNIATDTKLVFRRNKAAMKFFQVDSRSRGEVNKSKLSYSWGYVHDCYHPLPNQPGQGAEGSAVIFTYANDYSCDHLIIYAIAMDSEEKITGWHIKQIEENVFLIEPPEKEGGYSLQMAEDKIIVKDNYKGLSYEVFEDKFLTE